MPSHTLAERRKRRLRKGFPLKGGRTPTEPPRTTGGVIILFGTPGQTRTTLSAEDAAKIEERLKTEKAMGVTRGARKRKVKR